MATDIHCQKEITQISPNSFYFEEEYTAWSLEILGINVCVRVVMFRILSVIITFVVSRVVL